MSESNLYCTLYFDHIEKRVAFEKALNNPVEIKDGFHNYLEGTFSNNHLLSLSFMGGNLFPMDITNELKKSGATSMLFKLVTDAGSTSSTGYIENKKVSYTVAEKWMSEKSLAIAFQIEFTKGNRKNIEALFDRGLRLGDIPESENILTKCCLQTETPLALFFIEQGADVNAVDQTGASILTKAINAKNTKVVEALLRHGADISGIGNNILHRCASISDGARARKMLKLFLNNDIDVNQIGAFGRTPAMCIAYGSDPKALTTLKLLEKNGADLLCESEERGNLLWLSQNYISYDSKWHPIHKCILGENNAVADYLRKKGVELKLPNSVCHGEANYADHYICDGKIFQLDPKDYPEWFDQSLADALAADAYSGTKQVLFESKVYFNLREVVVLMSNSRDRDLLKLVFSTGLKVPIEASHYDLFDNIGYARSHNASENRECLERLKLFIEHDLDFEAILKRQAIAHKAITFSSPNKIQQKDAENSSIQISYVSLIIDTALKSGLDIDSFDENNHTMLMRAAAKGQNEIIELLLERGASKEITNDENETALDIAISKGGRLCRVHKDNIDLKLNFRKIIKKLGGNEEVISLDS
jgi:ankyrin repeat protein